MISKAQSDMVSSIQRRVNEIIANKLKAERAAVGEDLAAFEQRIGVDEGGGQPATGKHKSELGIHPVIDRKVG